MLQVVSEESLRLTSLILVQIRLQHEYATTADPAFSAIWALALGWAAVEVAVSITQGYAQIGLYSDIAYQEDGEHRNEFSQYVWAMEEQPTLPVSGVPRYQPDTEADHVFFKAFDKLLRARARVELEALYGIPVPVSFIANCCLFRLLP